MIKQHDKVKDVDMVVDEEIWGHRIYNEQTPWLCFLEFLSVLYSEHKDAHRGFQEDIPNTLSYQPRYRLYLRNILFNNPRIVSVMRETNDDETQWQKWLKYIEEDCAGLGSNGNFSYLRKHFDKFADFAKIVGFLRGTSIEGDSNKRWSSKFVFPYGPACFYEDLSVTEKGTPSNDRRFFARTGEVLYLMLSRSGKGPELLDHLEPLLFNENTKWNRIVQALQPKDEEVPSRKREGAYLPVGRREEYVNLAEDWLRILNCHMPGHDALPYMIDIMGLHMIRYLLNKAREVLGQTAPITFVLEIISPEKNTVHQLATQSFRENNRLTQQAIEAYIQQKVSATYWQEAIQANDVEALEKLFEKEFYWELDEDLKNRSGSDIIAQFTERTQNRHKRHLDKVHSTWGTEIGLSSRRHSRNIRYTPQDTLLRTLVLCTISERLEFQEFLEALKQKYGFIIGPHQAADLFDAKKAEEDDFAINAKRLEDRLASLGLLKRLSDACAYVENPFYQETR